MHRPLSQNHDGRAGLQGTIGPRGQSLSLTRRERRLLSSRSHAQIASIIHSMNDLLLVRLYLSVMTLTPGRAFGGVVAWICKERN